MHLILLEKEKSVEAFYRARARIQRKIDYERNSALSTISGEGLRMKIMLFIAGQAMEVIVARWTPTISELPQDFVIATLVPSTQKTEFREIISQIQQSYKRIEVLPVYLKSHDSGFGNLLNPYIVLSDFSSIFRALLHSRPDVIICFHLAHAYPLVILRRILKFSLFGYAMGADVNKSWKFTRGFFDRIMKQFVYRGCDMIFAVADDLKKKIEKLQSCYVAVVPHGVNPEYFKPLRSKAVLRQKWGIRPEDTVILTVCRLDKNKGVDVLIKALKVLNSNEESQYAFKLLVCGKGVERKSLERLSSVLGVKESVTFLGFRDIEELLELYNLADMFALASYSEGLPKALLEAMACGCVPVATAVGDVGTVVVDGFNGFIVNPGDYKGFSEKIKQGMSFSAYELSLMQSRARLAITDNFDYRLQIRKIIDIISTVRPPK